VFYRDNVNIKVRAIRRRVKPTIEKRLGILEKHYYRTSDIALRWATAVGVRLDNFQDRLDDYSCRMKCIEGKGENFNLWDIALYFYL